MESINGGQNFCFIGLVPVCNLAQLDDALNRFSLALAICALVNCCPGYQGKVAIKNGSDIMVRLLP